MPEEVKAKYSKITYADLYQVFCFESLPVHCKSLALVCTCEAKKIDRNKLMHLDYIYWMGLLLFLYILDEQVPNSV